MTEGPPVLYSEKAKELHAAIVTELSRLCDLQAASCRDEAFRKGFLEIARLYDLYQEEVLAGSQLTATCSKGCSWCCSHWVDDVYSFEAELVADYIEKNFPERIPDIKRYLEEDRAQLDYLEKMLQEKIAADHVGEDLDRRDLLLSCFYILNRPCILLDVEGACSVYPVRPLTCRIYVSLGPPIECDPETADEMEPETCILDLDKEADALLEKLHDRYDRFDDERGLRALLLKLLP